MVLGLHSVHRITRLSIQSLGNRVYRFRAYMLFVKRQRNKWHIARVVLL